MPVFYDVLSKNIRVARKAAGYTQQQIAEMLDMSVLNYGRLERGQRKVSLEKLASMAEAFGCSVYALLNDCFPVEISTIFDEKEPGVFSEKVVAVMAGCTEEEQEMIYEICRLVVYRKALMRSEREI